MLKTKLAAQKNTKADEKMLIEATRKCQKSLHTTMELTDIWSQVVAECNFCSDLRNVVQGIKISKKNFFLLGCNAMRKQPLKWYQRLNTILLWIDAK